MLCLVNPFSYSSVIASDRDLAYGVFDTKTYDRAKFEQRKRKYAYSGLHSLMPNTVKEQ